MIRPRLSNFRQGDRVIRSYNKVALKGTSTALVCSGELAMGRCGTVIGIVSAVTQKAMAAIASSTGDDKTF